VCVCVCFSSEINCGVVVTPELVSKREASSERYDLIRVIKTASGVTSIRAKDKQTNAKLRSSEVSPVFEEF
jgi:hypothetical protein